MTQFPHSSSKSNFFILYLFRDAGNYLEIDSFIVYYNTSTQAHFAFVDSVQVS